MPEDRPRQTIDAFSFSRRSFLKYVGAGAGAALGAGQLVTLAGCTTPGEGAWIQSSGIPAWTPPPYPVPLPGDESPSSEDKTRLARYEVADELILPEGFRYDVVAQWGDRFGPVGEPEKQIDFGYNNDFTGLVPVPGQNGEYWLMVNHEFVSPRSWLAAEAEDGVEVPDLRLKADPRYKYGHFSLDGWELPKGNLIDVDDPAIPLEQRETMRRLSDRGLAAQGVSILRVRRLEDGRLEVIKDATDHRRIATQTHANIEPGTDGQPPFRFTGPAAAFFDEPPRGTFCNCSGGVTPWGTFLTCEENIQYQAHEEISPAGTLIPGRRSRFGGTPTRIAGVVVDNIPVPAQLNGMGYAASRRLDGRAYGWVCEIDPRDGSLRKHTVLGRFRHENVTLRVEAGKRLAAYMGDDRRGGHVWKFVSDELVSSPEDPANSRLLERGTLYVARFDESFEGRWIPLEPETPLVRPEPEHCPTAHLRVPARSAGGYVAVGDTERHEKALEVEQWQRTIERFTGKDYAACTLGDLVTPELSGDETTDHERRQGLLRMDAFAMANTVGGTPTARPEDLEVHPFDKSVYIAFTDATDSSEGSPDERIFRDSKRESSRQYGAVFRLAEDGDDPAAESFTWGKLVSSGEVAAQGGGFANADNLVFDPEGNLWMVTDITTTALNFPTQHDPVDGTQPGGKQFPGVFGNNAVFMIPTRGPKAGVPHLFAIGPMECEICGPTFTEDGRTLIFSVQHPGERHGVRRSEKPSETHTYRVHDRDSQPFEQQRTVPLGSNFPSGKLDTAPRPCVVCITREG